MKNTFLETLFQHVETLQQRYKQILLKDKDDIDCPVSY